MSKAPKIKVDELTDVTNDLPICGIIMPIAKTDGYNDSHWADVYSILCEVATDAGFNGSLVSFDDDVGIIHKRIVHNIYSNPIVICDISSRNANVMLELGMRLAFDKPTIIVKDNKTPYSFDIAAIEHLEYPSDLRYQLINDFKVKLKGKLIETYKRSNSDPEFTTFLKHFGTFKVAKLDEREVTGGEFIAAEVREIKELILNSQTFSKQPQISAFNSKITMKQALTSEVINVEFDEDLPDHLSLSGLSAYLKTNGFDVIGMSRDEGGRLLNISFTPSSSTITTSRATRLIYQYVNRHRGN